jgi:5'(3')-deoxyribonucleotidase
MPRTAHKKTIALDLDEVVVETAGAIIAHYNKSYGTKMLLKDYYSTDYKNTWQTPDVETAIRRVNSYLETPEYSAQEPVRMAIETIRALGKKYNLYIITGRPDFTEEATRRWLKKHFPDVFRDVIFSNFYDPNKIRHKGDICLEIGAELLIDDHLGHILNVAACGMDGLLFGNYPWNVTEQALPDNVQRVRDWEEVAGILL